MPASGSKEDSRSTIRRKLGRGLGSLISTPVRVEPPITQSPVHQQRQSTSEPHNTEIGEARGSDGLVAIPIESIRPNQHQPRQHFDQAALEALAASIRVSGVMQPVVARRTAVGGGYELIAGERRWRAAKLVGLSHIPAVVKDVDDRTAAEFSLVENLQREDLNPIERAEAFRRLMVEFQLTQAEVAERVSLDPSNISNHLRLLDLDQATRAAVQDGRLSMGHAKALLAITNNSARATLAAEAVRAAWSVRELERRARDIARGGSAGGVGGAVMDAPGARGKPAALPNPMSAHLADLEKRLGEHLGTKVAVHTGRVKGTGKLVIDFYSIDQFEGVLRRLDFEMET